MKITKYQRPLINPHDSALKQDEQLRAQQRWDKLYKRCSYCHGTGSENFSPRYPDCRVCNGEGVVSSS